MDNNSFILADLDEIVFENREREYGAYQLRRKYNRHLRNAALIAFFLFAAVTTAPIVYRLLTHKDEDDSLVVNKAVVMQAVAMEAPPPEEVEPPPPVEPPKIQTIEFKVPVPAPDEEVVEEETIHEMEKIEEEANVGTQDQEGDDKGYDFGEIDGKGEVAAVEVKEPEPDPMAFVAVEKEPAPVNMDEIKKLIGYPPPAKEAGIEGQVVMRILVSKEGKYVKHIVTKSPHPMLTKAVEDQLKNLNFTPGVQAGKPISVWVTIPFKFKLAN